jgi:hypothetical protein
LILFWHQTQEDPLIDHDLADYALSLVLDNTRICEWATLEVSKRLKREGPQDYEFWETYTAVINELLDAARKANDPVPDVRTRQMRDKKTTMSPKR